MGNKQGKTKEYTISRTNSRESISSSVSSSSKRGNVLKPLGKEDKKVLDRVTQNQSRTPAQGTNQKYQFIERHNHAGVVSQNSGGTPSPSTGYPPPSKPTYPTPIAAGYPSQCIPFNRNTGNALHSVSSSPAFSAASAQSPASPSQASPSVRTPPEHNNPHANHLVARRSMSVDHVLDIPTLSALTAHNQAFANGISPMDHPLLNKQGSLNELAQGNPILKPVAVSALQQHGSPKLPPKNNTPRGSPKITRINVSPKERGGMPRNFSSPVLARRSTKRLQGQSKLVAKSFEDLHLVVSETEPPRLPNETKTVIFLAMYDFDSINDDDMSFKKGDRLKKVNASDTADWVVCVNLTNGNKGYIPVNYVRVDDDSPQAQDWWFDCGRNDAETWLLRLGVIPGSFLVRDSSDKQSYSMSVRWQEPDGKTPCVRHYRIRWTDNGQVYIGTRKMFADVNKLVQHYHENDDGLVCKLTEACPRIAPVTHLRNIEVRRDAIQLTEKIGAGYFGEVWKGKLRGKLNIAVKTLKPGRMTAHDFIREGKTMNKLRHVRLVQLLAVCTTCEPMLLITEYMVNGSLLDFLRKERRTKLDFKMMINMNRQIAEGMAYLESKNYIHRDLRAGNILVSEHYDVKVADFGLARVVVEEGQYVAGGTRFPIKWTAPEGVLYGKFSIKSDVWSFGILMYEIATSGKEPYAGMASAEVVQEVQKGYRLPKPREHWMPEQIDPYYNLMQICWKREARDRPSFFHLHQVFEDFTTNMEKDYGDV